MRPLNYLQGVSPASTSGRTSVVAHRPIPHRAPAVRRSSVVLQCSVTTSETPLALERPPDHLERICEGLPESSRLHAILQDSKYTANLDKDAVVALRAREVLLESDDKLVEKEILRRVKIGVANKGRSPWNVGKQWSPDTRALISRTTKAALGRAEVRQRLSDSLRGRVPTQETREKIRDSLIKHYDEVGRLPKPPPRRRTQAPKTASKPKVKSTRKRGAAARPAAAASTPRDSPPAGSPSRPAGDPADVTQAFLERLQAKVDKLQQVRALSGKAQGALETLASRQRLLHQDGGETASGSREAFQAADAKLRAGMARAEGVVATCGEQARLLEQGIAAAHAEMKALDLDMSQIDAGAVHRWEALAGEPVNAWG